MTNSKSVMDTLKALFPVFIHNDPETSFPLLFDYVYAKLTSLITEETLLEEEVETSIGKRQHLKNIVYIIRFSLVLELVCRG